MKKLIFLTVIFSLVVFSCNHSSKTASVGEMASKDSLGNGPVIYFPQDTLDFGTLKEGEKYEFKFALMTQSPLNPEKLPRSREFSIVQGKWEFSINRLR